MSDWKEAHKQIEDTKLAAQRVVDLLDDPHPGLFSWNTAFHNELRKLNKLAGLEGK